MKNLILLLLTSVLIISCKKEGEEYHELRLYINDFNDDPASGASVKLYNSETDFLTKQNAVVEGTADASGDFIYRSPTTNQFYILITKDTLNNLRNNQTHTNDASPLTSTIKEGNDQIKVVSCHVTLYTTPTKLQLNVKEGGVALPDAIVYLYYSQEEYDNHNFFTSDLTNNSGTILFNNLEPREYWIKVRKSNSGSYNNPTPNKTTKLPDNADITTVLDIGI